MNTGSLELGKPGHFSPVLEKRLFIFGNSVLAINMDTEHGGKRGILLGGANPGGRRKMSSPNQSLHTVLTES